MGFSRLFRVQYINAGSAVARFALTVFEPAVVGGVAR